MFHIIAITNDLKEVTLYSGDVDDCIKLLNTLAKRFGYTFKKDTSLFGGYYVAKTGICYLVK